ncbi:MULTISPECIES: GAF and ANTAR domain-containing protein [unclassified Arthrobacter]|uniref:GAF and ANTAR domain-containing protein n=1 Tax=unclassified Arthrobacter TaxID=235627 RepID=UPI002E0C53E5|nr:MULTISPECIES: GAF and ANTAR domain-containing protein [unclassified Arthrobacter]MEC5189771.1 GAF domain-containing protein [Arthrobacter sp. MP_M4]MEC5201238.1 GAF domain-containing protein [Arthrobacter sp. MP_M7]
MLNQPFNPLPIDELTAVFARIKGLLLTEDKVDRALELLVQAVKDVIPGSAGAGVSVFDALGQGRTTAATGRYGEQADAAQHRLGQGPSLDAWTTHKTIMVHDAAADARWPLWSQTAVSLPVRSVVSTPLSAAGGTIGTLTLYAALPAAYTANTGHLLESFAVPTATLLAHVQGPATPQRLSDPLKAALEARDNTNRACGILMERSGLSAEEAFRELLHRARTSGEPISRVCSTLITGQHPGAGVADNHPA